MHFMSDKNLLKKSNTENGDCYMKNKLMLQRRGWLLLDWNFPQGMTSTFASLQRNWSSSTCWVIVGHLIDKRYTRRSEYRDGVTPHVVKLFPDRARIKTKSKNWEKILHQKNKSKGQMKNPTKETTAGFISWYTAYMRNNIRRARRRENTME